jgi:hypothetical protein
MKEIKQIKTIKPKIKELFGKNETILKKRRYLP